MSEELFAVPQGGKPALLQARERLVQAEREQIACDMAVDAMGAEAVPELKAAEERVRTARAEVRRLELEALNEARRSTLDPQHASPTKEGV